MWRDGHCRKSHVSVCLCVCVALRCVCLCVCLSLRRDGHWRKHQRGSCLQCAMRDVHPYTCLLRASDCLMSSPQCLAHHIAYRRSRFVSFAKEPYYRDNILQCAMCDAHPYTCLLRASEMSPLISSPQRRAPHVVDSIARFVSFAKMTYKRDNIPPK